MHHLIGIQINFSAVLPPEFNYIYVIVPIPEHLTTYIQNILLIYSAVGVSCFILFLSLWHGGTHMGSMALMWRMI